MEALESNDPTTQSRTMCDKTEGAQNGLCKGDEVPG